MKRLLVLLLLSVMLLSACVEDDADAQDALSVERSEASAVSEGKTSERFIPTETLPLTAVDDNTPSPAPEAG